MALLNMPWAIPIRKSRGAMAFGGRGVLMIEFPAGCCYVTPTSITVITGPKCAKKNRGKYPTPGAMSPVGYTPALAGIHTKYGPFLSFYAEEIPPDKSSSVQLPSANSRTRESLESLRLTCGRCPADRAGAAAPRADGQAPSPRSSWVTSLWSVSHHSFFFSFESQHTTECDRGRHPVWQ